MTLTSLISSIIALAFLYTVFSVFASELQEYIAAIFESRAKRLKHSIRQMLGEQDWPFYTLEIEKDTTMYLVYSVTSAKDINNATNSSKLNTKSV